MLKLPKGLKKKKKKSKKDKELFTEEELEEYKRKLHEKELQQQEQEVIQKEQQPENEEFDVAHTASAVTAVAAGVPGATESQATTSTEPKKAEDDEEWSKFKALTAGVDSILHKTQDDLDRIKSTSFFKRVPPPSEQRKAAKEEAARQEAERLEEERRKKAEEEANRDVLAEAVVELSESEEESEEADDIFDTEYIEAITSGEVQFAIVPDSPEFEVADGPDPFDTSYADKLIKGPEVSKRGKKLVSIGAAVEVLTGRVETAQPAARRRPRRGVQDLLLDNFDDAASLAVEGEAEPAVTPEPPKTLLDDIDDDIPEELPPIDLSVSLHLALQKQVAENSITEPEENNKPPVDVISEFDVLKDDEDDEFAELAVESLTKKEEITVITKVERVELPVEVAGNWAEFEVQPEETVQVKAKPPPRPPPVGGVAPAAVQPESDDEFPIPEDDPFDTAFVEKIIPGKNDDDDDFDFDPRAEEKKPDELKVDRDLLGGSNRDLGVSPAADNQLTAGRRDLLGGSVTDLTAIGPTPINPLQDTGDKPEANFDPFDTSAITSLVQPKGTELKFLEKELLAENPLKHSLSDPDFDPRADEEEPKDAASAAILQDTAFDSARRKSSLHLNIQSKTVVFLVPNTDLLGSDHDAGKHHKPLTPYYSKKPIDEKESEDPFDTSFVPEAKPTQIELNLIERDLLSSTSLHHSLSDPDFDPRSGDATNQAVASTNSDLLVVESQIDIKVLTPAAERKNAPSVEVDFVDPFDTSSVEQNILPGKTELKLLENELLTARTPETVTGVLDTQTDAQELGLGDKVLTPQAPAAEPASPEEIDPFDTSFAVDLGPGQAEIKVLENELIKN